ncbi:MAG: alanine racemase [Phycisphaerae bacterium]|nr:alanine racemase [Phycisphaerae bacterium]
MSVSSQIEIHLDRLDSNLDQFQRFVGDGCRVCAVVKADAYGLGAVPVARRLATGGVDLFAVYDLAQAAELVEASVPGNLLVLKPVHHFSRGDELYRALSAGRLELTVHTAEQLEDLAESGRQLGLTIPIHLEIDTGMSRLGMTLEEAAGVLPALAQRRHLKLMGLFTHPSSADSDDAYTENQLAQLDSFVETHAEHLGDDVAIHFAGTYAALRHRRYHKMMVRLGLGLFGYGLPGTSGRRRKVPQIEPVTRWVSEIIHVMQVPTGTPVGYGGTFVTRRPSRLGVVPAGYADGYPLALSDRAVVRVGEDLQPAPVRGQVNMDQICVDLTEVSGAGVGSPAELIALERDAVNALPALAELAGSSCYEMLCRLGPRVPRCYLRGPRPAASTEAAVGGQRA